MMKPKKIKSGIEDIQTVDLKGNKITVKDVKVDYWMIGGKKETMVDLDSLIEMKDKQHGKDF